MHTVIVEIDGTTEEFVARNATDAERIAEAVLDAAMQLSTVQVPVGDWSSRGVTIVGHVVFDLAKAKRTSVRVEARSLQAASMGIKK